ncbi:MAG: sulfotransferase domain-containing protein [Chthoniobacterales bacterium]
MNFRRDASQPEKLDFILAGAQKAGTTALHYFLEKHPNIALSDDQELHFFDNENRFAQTVDYAELHRHFRVTHRTRVSGECTPTYTYWKPALERIWNYNREIKLIILLRNPAERAFSHWNMQRERGFDPLDFLPALQAEPQRLAEAAPLQSRRFSYLDRGFYSEQLERVNRFFPKQQVLVLKYETFRDEQQKSLATVLEFLGVPPLRSVRFKERNKIAYERRMTRKEADYLAEIYRSEIEKIEQLLGWDCSDWRSSAGR